MTKCIEDPTCTIFSKGREFKNTDAEITKTNTKTYTKTKTNTNTKTKKRTKTKCIEDPTYAIFSKSRELKDIKYDQTRPRREESNLADLILELAFLLILLTKVKIRICLDGNKSLPI